MAFGRGGPGYLRGASLLGAVVGSVASTAISALQVRHFTFTKLPATRRRYRSSLSENREPHAGQDTVMGICAKLPRAPGRIHCTPVWKGSIESRTLATHSVDLQPGHNCG